MKRRDWAVLPAVLAAVLAVLSGVLLTPVGNQFSEFLRTRGWDQPEYLGLLLLAVAAVLGGFAYWQYKRQHPEEAPPDEAQRREYRRLLIQKVRQGWIDGVLETSLYAIARKEFELEERPLEYSVREGTSPNRPTQDSLRTIYEARNEPLLILGDPGTGKTTLLLELTRHLLEHAQRDDYAPVPVVFALSSWAVRRQPLEEWMAGELERMGVGSKLAQTWASGREIVPMLDGLDEVAHEHRSTCVTRINKYRQAHSGIAFVVTSREREYDDLAVKLHLHSAIVVKTLDRPGVESYLQKHGEKLAGLRQALAAETRLWEVMDTPLMLNIAAFAFETGATDAGLTRPGVPLRSQLFERYVDNMLQRKNFAPPFSYDNSRKWLAELAAALVRTSRTTFHLEDLEPEWLPGAQRSAARRWLRVAPGLIVGLIFGLIVGLKDVLIDGLIYVLIYGLSAGLTLGLWGVLTLGLSAETVSERSGPNEGLRRSARHAARSGLLVLPLALVLTYTSTRVEGLIAIWLHSCAVTTALVGAILTFLKGGFFCVKNLMMRALLWRWGYAPRQYTRFLNYAVERILLRQVGGAYLFLHRMLMEHLALQSEDPPPLPQEAKARIANLDFEIRGFS